MNQYYRKLRNLWDKHEIVKGLILIGVVLLGAVVVWGGVRFIQNTEYPVLVVSSGSMCPPSPGNCTLPIGSLIVIKGQDPNTIVAGPACGQPLAGQLGSIIVFRPYPTSLPDFLVVHRVREVSVTNGNLLFKTQGDANPGCDGWIIPAGNVLGVYQYTIPIPYLGSAILSVREFLGTLVGRLLIIGIIAALFLLEVFEPTRKSAQNPKEKDVESVKSAPSERVPNPSTGSTDTG